MEFKERLKELRKSKRITMETLADKIGVTYNTISMYESGKRMPSRSTSELLADYFNVDIDYLLGKTDIARKIDVESIMKKDLSKEELSIITAYRNANDKTRAAIRLMLGMDI